ncbi:hypothetical protein ARMGADRAFT_951015, partial [Armillaria gallica]
FFKRFPIHLADDIEPTAEDLTKVDDQAPDPEIEHPNEDELDAVEYQKKIAEFEADEARINYRKKVSEGTCIVVL